MLNWWHLHLHLRNQRQPSFSCWMIFLRRRFDYHRPHCHPVLLHEHKFGHFQQLLKDLIMSVKILEMQCYITTAIITIVIEKDLKILKKIYSINQNGNQPAGFEIMLLFSSGTAQGLGFADGRPQKLANEPPLTEPLLSACPFFLPAGKGRDFSFSAIGLLMLSWTPAFPVPLLSLLTSFTTFCVLRSTLAIELCAMFLGGWWTTLLFVGPKPTTDFTSGVAETAGCPSTLLFTLCTKELEIPQNLKNMLVSHQEYKDTYKTATHACLFRVQDWAPGGKRKFL